jgi:2-polyprenyl-6-hydroxyphenyl methylase/3-demethylubiquinone-9 3-methyltransferase
MARDPGRVVPVNNAIYTELGEQWYSSDDSPVALLRAESKLRNPWLAARLSEAFADRTCRVLDVGCGAGFLSNYLAAKGAAVTGIDLAPDALAIAREHDSSGRARYIEADALSLPFADGSFDAVCAMDFLEHVETPGRAIAEASRVLAPGGLFFFYTFNRTLWSWLVIIKGVDWFVRNAPPHLHVLHLFLKPRELRAACLEHGFEAPRLIGVRPKLTLPLWRMLLTGRVGRDFAFTFTRSTRLAYAGVARKREEAASAASPSRRADQRRISARRSGTP